MKLELEFNNVFIWSGIRAIWAIWILLMDNLLKKSSNTRIKSQDTLVSTKRALTIPMV